MAVDLVTQMWSRKKGGVKSQDGKVFTFLQSDGFQVSTTPDGTMAEILAHPDIPKVGQSLSGAPFITVRDVLPIRQSPIYWIVDVQSEGKIGNDNSPSSSPIDNAPIVDGGSVETEEEIDQDYDGMPIVTVNGERIRGVKKRIYDYAFRITRNFLAINKELALEYLDAVNEDPFFGFPAGAVKMTNFTDREVRAGDLTYYNITGSFLARQAYNTTPEKAWYSRVLHQGFYEKVGDNIRRAVDDDGEPMTEPVLLALDGTRETDSSAAVWLEIKKYGKLPYNALGFI